MKRSILFLCCLAWLCMQAQNHPNGIDFIGPDGVTYPDFTYAGLEDGNQIPNVPTVTTVDASGSDDYQTIINAINALPTSGGAILLKNGTYFIDRPIEIRRDNVVIRGESRENTIIRTDGGSGALFSFQGNPVSRRGGFTNDWDRGDKTIDISGSGISVQPGDYLRLVINQGLPPEHRFRFKNQGASGIHPEDYRGIYQGEWEITIKKVVAVNGNLVTFLVPMRTRYRSAWGGEAQIRKDQFVRNNGVENLTIDNTNGGMNSFRMEAAANCWIKNVHVEKTQSHPIEWGYPLGGKNCLIEDCTFDGVKNTGGGGNGYFGFIYSHDCMYRRVQTYGMRHGPNIQSFSSGNVFLDCYSYSSNAEMHSRFARHNLIDRCTTNMENTWTEAGWKTTRLDQIDNGHDPAGGRHVLFNSYFYNIGATAIHAGGFNRDDVYAYNKWQVEGQELNDVLGNYTVQLFDFSDNLTIIGNKFANDERDPSYDYTEAGSSPFPGERRQGTLPYAAVMFLPGYQSGGGTENDPSKYGQTGVGWQRESASASDIVPGWGTSYQSTPVIPFARQYAQTNGTANNGYPLPQSPIMQGTGVTPNDIPQIHFIDNIFYGHNPATVPMFAGYNTPATNIGNTMIEAVPNMDTVSTTPFASSLYEWQMANKGIAAGGNLAPSPSFTFTTNTTSLSVNASNSSDADGSIVSYAWDFGDGSGTATGVSASYTYSASGTYTVELTVTDDSSATSSTTRSVTITIPEPAPVPIVPASFDFQVTSDYTGWQFTTDAEGDSSVVVYPGKNGFLLAESRTGLGGGDGFRVVENRLLIEANDKLYLSSDSASYTAPDSVDDFTFAISIIPSSTYLGAETFISTGGSFFRISNDMFEVQGQDYLFSQNFVPGDTLSIIVRRRNDSIQGWNNVGGSWVKNSELRVNSDRLLFQFLEGHDQDTLLSFMLEDSAYADVAALQDRLDGVVVDQANPVAGFTYTQSETLPDTVSFSSTSTDDVGIVSYEWDFGDGNTSTDQNAVNVYLNPGNYTVSLTVQDGAGNTATVTEIVSVADPNATPLISVTGVSGSYTGSLADTFQLKTTGMTDQIAFSPYERRDGIAVVPQNLGDAFRLEVVIQNATEMSNEDDQEAVAISLRADSTDPGSEHITIYFQPARSRIRVTQRTVQNDISNFIADRENVFSTQASRLRLIAEVQGDSVSLSFQQGSDQPVSLYEGEIQFPEIFGGVAVAANDPTEEFRVQMSGYKYTQLVGPEPPIISSIQVEKTSALLSWSPAQFANTYTVRLFDSASASSLRLEAGLVGTSYNFSSLTENRAYLATITATNGSGISEADSIYFRTPTAEELPDPISAGTLIIQARDATGKVVRQVEYPLNEGDRLLEIPVRGRSQGGFPFQNRTIIQFPTTVAPQNE